ncbi:MAG: nucleotidyl transferase AbiEii/AbiGii toxin family protein [Propionibacteriaceae bacterium]|jgi:hypothetical protein|nr:nucleotidyl transferase AbiEii/AbiGii toxin family protein [Propionibacteriaceae bacterium]
MMYNLPDEERPQPSARLLDQWVRDAQDLTGGVLRRIAWMLSSTVIIAALQRTLGPNNQPLFLVKGGLYLELRLGLNARTTKDVDVLFRGSAEEFERAIDAVLAEPWGPFSLVRTELERVKKANRVVKPYRFDIKLIVRGATWRRAQVEVSFPEGQIGEFATPVPAPTVGFFGVLPPDEIIGIAMDYQVAQKMHAASDPDVPPDLINDRVRDIIDLVLIKENLYTTDPTPATLKAACLDVFDARAAEAVAIGLIPRHWPPRFVANYPWEAAYPALAESVGMTYTLDEAITIARAWMNEITHS